MKKMMVALAILAICPSEVSIPFGEKIRFQQLRFPADLDNLEHRLYADFRDELIVSLRGALPNNKVRGLWHVWMMFVEARPDHRGNIDHAQDWVAVGLDHVEGPGRLGTLVYEPQSDIQRFDAIGVDVQSRRIARMMMDVILTGTSALEAQTVLDPEDRGR